MPSQIEYYNRVFDTLTLVTTKSHISKAREIIPKWWGIDCVNNIGQDIRIKTIRKPKDNHKVQLLDLTQLLWKDELLELLQSQGINKGVKSKTRYQLGVIVSDKVDREIVSTFVRENLKLVQFGELISYSYYVMICSYRNPACIISRALSIFTKGSFF